MSARCTCGYDGDPVVFGACRTCHPEPDASRLTDLPALVPSWVFTVPATEPAERPFETTLSDGDGDLG